MKNTIANTMKTTAKVLTEMAGHTGSVEEAAHMVIEALRGGNKLLLMGNGGSAADAQHIAGELLGRFYKERPSLAALALTCNSSVTTAIANDFGYESVFSRQVEGLAVPGDVVVGITTSGNSPNVVRGLEAARRKGARTIAMTGAKGGRVEGLADLCIKVPSNETPRIQEAHITVGHIICQLVEEALAQNPDDCRGGEK